MRLSTIALRNLTRHKTRSFLSMFTIVIACILGLFMLTLIEGMKKDLKQNILAYYTGAIQIRNEQYNTYDYLSPLHLYVKNEAELRGKLSQIPGVTEAVSRISAGGQIYIQDPANLEMPGEKFNAMAMGIDIPREKDILDPESLLVEGRLPAMGSREVVLGYNLAEKASLKTGDTFPFMSATAERGVNAMTFKVVGLVNFTMAGFNDNYFLLPFDIMQDFVRMADGAQEIILMTENPEESEEELKAVEQLLASDDSFSYLDTKLWKTQGDYYAMMGMGSLMYNFIVLFFLILGATVIINTTMMAIYERYREIGILGAMGMRPKELVRLFFLEALFAGIISAVVGITLGSALVLVLERTGMNFGDSISSMNIEISNILYPDLKAIHIILMTFYTVSISAIVTLFPSRKAAAIEPVDAIRST